jgi:hypothetical protein
MPRGLRDSLAWMRSRAELGEHRGADREHAGREARACEAHEGPLGTTSAQVAAARFTTREQLRRARFQGRWLAPHDARQ